jgi:RimJ/RimL family protein N-acetyltransferase
MMIKPGYPVKTARLTLRPFEDGDLQAMFAYHSLPEVVRFLYWTPRSLAETEEALQKNKSRTYFTEEGSAINLAVCLSQTKQLLGEVILFLRSEEHGQGEIGFVFNPQFSGQGYATEAAKAMLALGFGQLGFHRIYGRCDARNTASYKLMERLGLRREAHFVQNEIFKGEWCDELVYAVLGDEWQRSK